MNKPLFVGGQLPLASQLKTALEELRNEDPSLEFVSDKALETVLSAHIEFDFVSNRLDFSHLPFQTNALFNVKSFDWPVVWEPLMERAEKLVLSKGYLVKREYPGVETNHGKRCVLRVSLPG